MMPEYYCTLTTVGAGKLAQAGLLGQPLTITHAALGDGNPASAEPGPETVLVSEKYRSEVNTVYSPEEDPSVVIVEMAVPVEDGDWEVNEVGLYDSAGDLVAISNYPKTWKPKISSGTGRVLLIRIMVDVGSVENVTLKVDPAVVMATRQYVDNSAETSRQYTDGLVAGVIRYYDVVPAQNLGSLIYVWPLGIMRWFGDWYRSVECGRISLIGRPTPEPGTIKANGVILDKVVAPGLWSWAQEAGVVVPLVSWQPGTPFYAEISATQFMVPDLRAEHLRAWDDARGIDVGRGFGIWQDSANKSHAHTASSAENGGHAHTASSGAAGGHAHTASSGAAGGHAHTASSGAAGGHAHTASSDSQGEHTHNVHYGNTTPDGSDLGTPAEPRNPLNGTETPTVATTTTSAGGHAHNITVDAVGNHSHTVTVDAVADHGHTITVDSVANHGHTITVDSVANHGHAITVDASGGSESRGRNVALLAVIHL
jgi:hypothetical protein